jgi:predicted ATP-dependent serine protease
MEMEDLLKLKAKNPKTGFLYIFHATKEGKFRGANTLAHEMDVIIEVENNQAIASGRFNAGGQVGI